MECPTLCCCALAYGTRKADHVHTNPACVNSKGVEPDSKNFRVK